MPLRIFLVGALLVAGALPLAAQFSPLRASGPAEPPERAVAVAWPTHFRDQPLTQLPPGALEQCFARRFPGDVARFTDGERILVLRHVAQPTRELHPAEDCFRGADYRVGRAEPVVDDRGEAWRCFIAARAGRQAKVCERIHDAAEGRWTDPSEWFWQSQYGGGPWQAITVVTPQATGM